jgi:hypothetical protein
MIKFCVRRGPVVLPIGALLILSDALAKEHADDLARRDDGVFMGIRPTRWKNGDVIETDAPIPPIFAHLVEFAE